MLRCSSRLPVESCLAEHFGASFASSASCRACSVASFAKVKHRVSRQVLGVQSHNETHLVALQLILLHDLIWIWRSHRIRVVRLIESRPTVPIAHHVSTGIRPNVDATGADSMLRLRHIRIHVISHSHARRMHSRRWSQLAIIHMRLLTRSFSLNLISKKSH